MVFNYIILRNNSSNEWTALALTSRVIPNWIGNPETRT
jgi:hypothetical protein